MTQPRSPFQSRSPFGAAAAGGGPGPGPSPEALQVTLAPASMDTDEGYNANDTAWANRANILDDNASAATWTNATSNRGSQLLHVRFAAASIPTDAVVTGLEISYRASGTGAFSMAHCWLTFDGVISNSPAYTPNTDTFTTLVTRTLGGPGFTFGASVTPAALNAGRIGCALRVFRTGASAQTCSLEYVSLKVYYTTLVGKSTRGASVATVMLPFDGAALTGRRVRAAFPSQMGTPSAILFATTTSDRADRTNYLTRDVAKASMVGSYGMAVNNAAIGGVTYVNNAGTFDAKTAMAHSARSTPFAGQGLPNGDLAIESNNRNSQAKPTTFGDGYVDFVCMGSTSTTPCFLTVTAIYAASAHLYVADGFGTAEDPTRVITTGFAPNLILCLTLPDRFNSALHEAYAGVQCGAAKWMGSTWLCSGVGVVTASRETVNLPPPTQQSMTATRNSWELMTDALYHDWAPNYDGTGVEGIYSSLDFRYSITARSGTGYTLTCVKDKNPGQSNAVFLALDMGAVPFDIGFFDTPTATGAATLPTSFQPSAMLLAMTNSTATGRNRDEADTGALALAMASIDGHAATHGFFWPNGTPAPSPAAQSHFDSTGLEMIDAAAATVFQASVNRFTATGVELNVTTAPVSASKVFGVFIG